MSENLLDLEILKRSSEHLSTLQAAGYDVCVPSTYDDIAGLVAGTGRKQQSPMFSIQRNDFTRGDAFWLFLEIGGKVVAGCAAQFYDLRDEPIDTFLRRSSRAQYHRDTDPIASIAAPIREKLRGKLIYIGELEFHPDHRGKPAVVFAFLRLLQALAAIKWPDFHAMYAIIPAHHVKLADGYGFTWKIPRAITWHDPVPQGRLNDHWLVAIDRTDFDHLWRG